MISQATVNDIPELEKLINSAYRGEYSKKGWTTEADLLGGIRIHQQALRELIDDPHSVILKYEDADELIGCVYLKKDGDRMYLGMLTVDPEKQAGGIGKKLMSYSENYAIDRSCKSVYMRVVSVRHELIAWYERHGYAKTGEVQPFEGPNVIGQPKQHLEFIVLEKNL